MSDATMTRKRWSLIDPRGEPRECLGQGCMAFMPTDDGGGECALYVAAYAVEELAAADMAGDAGNGGAL